MDASRIKIHPLADSTMELDATDPVVRALAYELWKRFGARPSSPTMWSSLIWLTKVTKVSISSFPITFFRKQPTRSP